MIQTTPPTPRVSCSTCTGIHEGEPKCIRTGREYGESLTCDLYRKRRGKPMPLPPPRPVRVVRVTLDQVRERLAAAGLAESVAEIAAIDGRPAVRFVEGIDLEVMNLVGQALR